MGPGQQLVRANVYQLGDDWADPILWYARGVAALQKLALDEPTSWRFFAAIHGFDQGLWEGFGAWNADETMPGEDVQSTFWQQCQHGSWYFLPWHRGYLLAFEAVVRKAITDLGGPVDWTLPYWNYFNTGEAELPPAFASADWPDGMGDNPLFVTQRYGPGDPAGTVFVPLDEVDLNALGDPDFTGVGGGGDPGFGGVDTGFSHGGPVHGALETQPHDQVHVLVGGSLGNDQDGMMSNPDSAGLDPIFWLHHANIDRLWESWRRNPPQHVDPTDVGWLTGPAEQAFAMPRPDGSTWNYTASDVAELTQVGYTYDDLNPGTAVPPTPSPDERLTRLGMRTLAANAAEGADMASGRNVELVGASKTSVPVVGGRVHTTVRLDPATRDKVTASLAPNDDGEPAPDRVFLNLENVRGLADATVLQVYVGLPGRADPSAHPDHRAGTVGLFGVSKASRTDGDQAGQGLTYVLDITNIVDRLHLRNELGDNLSVVIVPRRSVSADDRITIGRVSVFRQGR